MRYSIWYYNEGTLVYEEQAYVEDAPNADNMAQWYIILEKYAHAKNNAINYLFTRELTTDETGKLFDLLLDITE
jgi:hypothetical protein